MRVLVTGGTGFVGHNLAKRLVRMGYEVWITGSDSEAGVAKGTRLVSVEEACSMRFDACMHQAANNDTLDESDDMVRSNVFMPARLFNRLASNGCHRFVYASSTAVYGNRAAPYSESTKPEPLNWYAKSKLAFEEFASDFAVESQSVAFGLRYCNVYGPGEFHKGRRSSMIMQMANQMMAGGRPRIFRDGGQKRDWIYVDDVVDANLACLSAPKGGIFNVAGGRSVSFNHLVRVLNEAIGTELEPDYIECEFKEKYQNDTECDISRARDVLRWSPKFTVEAGIREYLPFLRSSL